MATLGLNIECVSARVLNLCEQLRKFSSLLSTMLPQGVSRAGKQRGRDHHETGLIDEVYRVLDESGALLGCHCCKVEMWKM